MSVLRLDSIIDDRGLLLALHGLTIRMALPARCPFEPRDNLLAACAAAICLDRSSRSESWAYVTGAAPGRDTPKSEGIISCEMMERFQVQELLV